MKHPVLFWNLIYAWRTSLQWIQELLLSGAYIQGIPLQRQNNSKQQICYISPELVLPAVLVDPSNQPSCRVATHNTAALQHYTTHHNYTTASRVATLQLAAAGTSSEMAASTPDQSYCWKKQNFMRELTNWKGFYGSFSVVQVWSIGKSAKKKT